MINRPGTDPKAKKRKRKEKDGAASKIVKRKPSLGEVGNDSDDDGMMDGMMDRRMNAPISDGHDTIQHTGDDSDQDEDAIFRDIPDEDVFVDLTLARAQILKNFLDRIRHQNSDLPLMFKKDGLYIQSMEPGNKAWVHAHIAASGCESYDYRTQKDTLSLTLEFKSIYSNVKSIDANDQLRIRVLPNQCKDKNKRNDRYNVSLICINEKSNLSSEWILDTIGDENINSERMVTRIADYWDYEYAILACELQRKITMFSANKTQSLYFICQGRDLIVKQKGKFATSMVTAVTTEFSDSFCRGPTLRSPAMWNKSQDYNEDSSDKDTDDETILGKAPECPILVAVDLKHLVNACKGSSTNNNSKQMIHIRISTDVAQDMLLEESVGNVGRLTLGVAPIQ